MKNRLFLTLSVLSILTLLFSFAAAPARGIQITGLTLISTKFESGKGVVLTFAFEGDTSQTHYHGMATIQGTEFPMHCQVNDDTNTLRCVIGGGISQFEGQTVSGSVLGFPFSTEVPARRSPSPVNVNPN